MTLHEIEDTVHNLVKRHSELDETMLVTLLRAGGWEEKHIEEAKMVFRIGTPSKESRVLDENEEKKNHLDFPPLQESPVLPLPVDDKHLLVSHTQEVVTQEVTLSRATPEAAAIVPHNEQQSLVVSVPQDGRSKKDELPHNLPLRPFETSEHIWPFSRYRDVFYGEEEVVEQKVTEMKPQSVQNTEIKNTHTYVTSTISVTPPPIVIEEKPIEKPIPVTPVIVEEKPKEIIRERIIERIIEKRIETPPSPVEFHIAPTESTNSDGRLVALACVMLVIIMVLLGYMYSNGRI